MANLSYQQDGLPINLLFTCFSENVSASGGPETNMTTADELARELDRVQRLMPDLHDPTSRAALSAYARDIEESLQLTRRAAACARYVLSVHDDPLRAIA